MEKAKDRAKRNLTKRKNPDWDNLDRGYRYLTQDMKLPHDQAIALMGNVIEESQGDYKAIQKNGGGRGLIQWDGQPAPKTRYGQWGKVWASVAKPANVYDKTTDTVKNYWAPWNGLKGEQVRQKFISAPLQQKARIYAESYLRPGKPRIKDRVLSTFQLDSIYNPKIKNISVRKEGGIIKAQEGTKFGNFLNNYGSTIVGGILQLQQLNKQKSAFDSYLKNKYNPNNLVNTDDVIQKTNQYLQTLKEQNPDVNYGEVDFQNAYQNIYNSELNKAKQQSQKLQEQNEFIQNNSNQKMDVFSNILESGLGLVGKYLTSNNKSSTKSITNTSNYKLDSFWTNPTLNTKRATS